MQLFVLCPWILLMWRCWRHYSWGPLALQQHVGLRLVHYDFIAARNNLGFNFKLPGRNGLNLLSVSSLCMFYHVNEESLRWWACICGGSTQETHCWRQQFPYYLPLILKNCIFLKYYLMLCIRLNSIISLLLKLLFTSCDWRDTQYNTY